MGCIWVLRVGQHSLVWFTTLCHTKIKADRSLDRYIKATYEGRRTVYSGVRNRAIFPRTTLRHHDRLCATARGHQTPAEATVGSFACLLLPRVSPAIPGPSQAYLFVNVREVSSRQHISCFSTFSGCGKIIPGVCYRTTTARCWLSMLT
jgi:hypothetical protein